jgi:hypothetical protein
VAWQVPESRVDNEYANYVYAVVASAFVTILCVRSLNARLGRVRHR